jgi:hypothetical protein
MENVAHELLEFGLLGKWIGSRSCILLMLISTQLSSAKDKVLLGLGNMGEDVIRYAQAPKSSWFSGDRTCKNPVPNARTIIIQYHQKILDSIL